MLSDIVNQKKRRVCVRGIIFRRGELLCQILHARDGSPEDFWCTPGGGLEVGEAISDGLRREMLEETGVTPDIGNLLFIQQFTDRWGEEENEGFELFFHIKNHQDYEKINLAATSHGEQEVAQVAFIDPRKNHVLPSFLTEVDIAAYIEGTLPVLLINNFGEA